VNLREYRLLLVVVTAVLVLIISLPMLGRLLVYTRTESFTELWILGPEHMNEDYPVDVVSGDSYRVYLGVGDHLGYYGYYVVQVKFRNLTQSSPDRTSGKPSSLAPLYSINMFVADNSSLELPIDFSFSYSPDETLSRISFDRMLLNGEVLNLNGYSTVREEQFFRRSDL
jgi:uncharacterized membrane protein